MVECLEIYLGPTQEPPPSEITDDTMMEAGRQIYNGVVLGVMDVVSLQQCILLFG